MKASSLRSSPRDIAGRDGLWLGVALLLVGLALVGVWQAPQRINANCARYLQQSELLFDGAVPYHDFVNTDPPLIAYLNLFPVVLARMLGVSPITRLWRLRRFLAADFGVGAALLLRQRRMGLPAVGRGLVLLAWIASYFVVDWHGDTGQQEHLFILLYVPYLFLRILRHRGGTVAVWLAILLGVQAGIGAALKWHFLFGHERGDCPVVRQPPPPDAAAAGELALLGVVAVYLVHWLFVPAAMREAFFGRWLPLISYGYGAYSVSYPQVAKSIFGSPISLSDWRRPWRRDCSSCAASRGCDFISWH